MLSFEHVSKFIIADMTIHIPKGVTVGIIGASGAGKTTFLRLACGLLAPEEGSVYTFGKNPVSARTSLGNRIGCLLERIPVLGAEKSIAENFRELQIIHRIPERDFTKEYEELAERFEIRRYEQEKVKNLSVGQRRRAELVAVLVHRPELLLLDEPTNGLDENAKNIFREVLKERVRVGMSVVLTSHDMREVSGTCQRIVVLESGKQLYYGEETALLQRYAPMDIMKLKLEGNVPDMEDLPLFKYSVQGDDVTLSYNSNHITSAEILEVVLRQTTVKEVMLRKPDLADVIMEIEKRREG